MDKKTYPSELQERFLVRFPDGMRDLIADAAKTNSRSMNSEIVARLTESLSGPPPRDMTFPEIMEALKKLYAHTSEDGGVTITVEVAAKSPEKRYPSREAVDLGMAQLDRRDSKAE